MVYKIDQCEGCNKRRYIVNIKYRLCSICNQSRLSDQKDNEPKSSVKKQSIKYLCSDGTSVTQSQIDSKRSAAYKKTYSQQKLLCLGCGSVAQGSAHIISQARCKQIHKTELIWKLDNNKPINFFPACHNCNSAIENPKGQQWKDLNNIDYCLEVLKTYDQELYNKFIVNIE